MPTQADTQPTVTQDDAQAFRQHLTDLSTVAIADVVAVWATLHAVPAGQLRALLSTVWPHLLAPYFHSATQLAATWYRALGPADSAFVPTPAALPPQEQLDAIIGWATKPMIYPATAAKPAMSAEVEHAHTPAHAAPSEPAAGAPKTAAESTKRAETPSVAAPETRAEAEPEKGKSPRVRITIRTPESASTTPPEAPKPVEAQSSSGVADDAGKVLARLSHSSQRLIWNQARDTVILNVKREGVRWVRVAQPDCCAFCRLMATHEAVYLTQKSALRVVGVKTGIGKPNRLRGSQELGERYHDSCRCIAIPIRDGESWEPPAYVDEWNRQYKKATKTVGNRADTKAILAEMRSYQPEHG